MRRARRSFTVAWVVLASTVGAEVAIAAEGGPPAEEGAVVAPPPPEPPAVQQVGVDEALGQTLPLDAVFTDETGKQVRLRDYFGDRRPVIIAPAYFRCVTLCDMLQRDLAYGLHHTPLALGTDYRVLTISIDPRDTPQIARVKQQGFLEPNGLYRQAAGWPFLTGEQPAVQAVMGRLGYRYAYDEKTQQYAHPAVIAVVTPEGRIARYLYGIQFDPHDLRLGLLEAGQEHIGGVVGRVLLTCFHYDPATRRYGVYVMGVLKLGGALVLFLVAGMIMLLWRLDRRRRRAAP